MNAERIENLPNATEGIEEVGEFSYHCSYSAFLRTTLHAAFLHLDDPLRLSSHMGKSSWMMAGSHMDFELDQGQGRHVGSEIILRGKMMGIPLFVRERIVERVPPKRKVWATIGPQKLIIIDRYRMGFELEEFDSGIKLRVFLDYALPSSWFGKILGKLFSGFYAKWCTKSMALDAVRYFSLKG